MDGKRFVVCFLNLEILVWILLAFAVQLSDEVDPGDVAAISSLYAALGSPSLPGWEVDGDPCNKSWQGVTCDKTNNIETIRLNGANLGGELGNNLGSFSSIKTIDLSNNHIGGSIPNLPVTLQNIFLSANAFTGSIPTSLSYLTRLSAMSLNDNHLTGEIPDSFHSLTALVNLDLSSNNLSGPLPPTLGDMSSLTALHLQDNQLSGTLDVLQDLPLQDLNVENNLFSGPIPPKLLSISNFKKDGNLFNISIAPLPPPTSSSAPPISGSPISAQTPPSQRKPGEQADGPSRSAESGSTGRKKSLSAKRVVWISIAAVLSFIILVLAILLFLPRCLRKWHETERTPKHHEIAPYVSARENPGDSGSLVQPGHGIEKASPVPPKEKQPRRLAPNPKPQDEQQVNVQTMSAVSKKDNSEINLSRLDINLMPPPPPPPHPPPQPTLPQERAIVKPIAAAKDTAMKPPTRPLPPTSVKSYTIALLQQYTNSFSQDNLLGSGMLGSVYRVELPNGKLLAVKKLDKRVCDHQKDDEFLDLVNNIDRICHANVAELMGYCAEHGQRLLVYEYCSNGTLQDALHSDDEFKKQLLWNTRVRMALGAARALEYLHEVCEPPIIHRNFKSANLLLDDELAVHVSDCGLAPLISSGAVSQLSGQLLTTYGYGAPEFESGIYTSQSDVYSFGVVMLELLTGRMSYDWTRSRGEQFLVRWAIPQLHDIDLLTRMVDPSLDGKYPVKSLSHFADIISRCVQHEPEFRPPMSEVVQDLIQMIRRESHKRSDGE
ncbi:Protein STRUBBELIG-RECEPTOR FAMILY 1 [Capsicum annuum]|uniref:protein STRUBBELIG-RECEPTOR FAMILY 3 n=1 Tax=Capsicum annuum TaxID=4072 RepID=UPI001FB0DA23|nr:protein STRUBBELIG-RECEPTOR FAMILY 3 [Capsicum annuum]XP_016541566.2 protein STRUBBELIG-RECEPTOR FAMILY 3 [Capsicum annuum]XP_047253100.1 protein STRUBBELIG-RECEPTOR FAMILY 3 [Capsicum annuum]XP_047253101.1 protein STRUBBELIG-RECEPTOR FAMILY 3 [Capsicum annuum]XP_047253102.1 protein STRUBBELIG-RECEPTOR FAMILY 3 [Capsicum annuum]XP_047253103.1 protein STRUBBELIG-RECEPTOR FAMILY 3 [Capsicum annuum]XP_047253104.1 protein STRUBBELIG-RECEPTOR FAMILY 3 [Capsicum annuum]XP_047253105.1 protein ST